MEKQWEAYNQKRSAWKPENKTFFPSVSRSLPRSYLYVDPCGLHSTTRQIT